MDFGFRTAIFSAHLFDLSKVLLAGENALCDLLAATKNK